MTPRWYLPRRTILRGFGTGIALPFLDAMVPGKLSRAAAADPKTSPRRFVGIWGLPCGQVGKWDEKQNSMVSPWTPDDEGPFAQDPSGFLAPFFGKAQGMGNALKGYAFKDIHTKLTLLTGLSDASFGHQFVAAMLAPGKISCHNGNNDCSDVVIDAGGTTADQIAANHFYDNQYTTLHSLSLSPVPGGGTQNLAVYSNHMSWKSGKVPGTTDNDPAAVFDKIFGQGDISPKEDATATALRKRNRSSVLDVVRAQAKRIQDRVGAQDKQKLGQYLESIFDLEKQITQMGEPLTCGAPERPMSQKGVAGGMGNLDKKIKLMVDLMVKAFECDRTRVGTLQYYNGNGSLGGWPFIGLTGEHHGHSHYTSLQAATVEGAKDFMNVYGKWALQMMAYFMSELDRRVDNPTLGTTMLDNAVMLMSGDCGDSDSHSWASANILLGGRGGQTTSGAWAINAGRHLRCSPPWQAACGHRSGAYCPESEDQPQPQIRFKGERTTKDLLWTMLKAVGVPDATITGGKPTFGYATAPLDLA